MPPLTVTLITRNEALNLDAALASAAWADEIVVVDSESTDGTVAIARRFTERVYVRAWEGFAAQKNHAAALASHDWILSLDADERVTPELAREVRSTLSGPPPHAAFRMPRAAFYLGRWIRSTDWYPDRKTRLYDRRRARWVGPSVHETLDVEGTPGELRGELQHYPYKDISEHLETIDRYTTYAAREMRDQGRRAGWPQLAGHPPLAFLRNYVARSGFRDGLPGFIISSLNAYYVFLKFAKLRELQGASPRTSNVERRT